MYLVTGSIRGFIREICVVILDGNHVLHVSSCLCAPIILLDNLNKQLLLFPILFGHAPSTNLNNRTKNFQSATINGYDISLFRNIHEDDNLVVINSYENSILTIIKSKKKFEKGLI